MKVGNGVMQRLDHLVMRKNIFKAAVGDRVLNSGVMSVERNNVGDAHIHKFSKRDCAVERFSGSAAVLAPFVEHRHNDGDAAGFSACGAD